jgi:hypothetical protein
LDRPGDACRTTGRLAPERGGAVTNGAANLVISDNGNSRVRVVAAATGTFYGLAMTAGPIYTVAGNGKGVSAGGVRELKRWRSAWSHATPLVVPADQA